MDSNGLRFWMLSQLNDWLPSWRASAANSAGPGSWQPDITYAAGQYILDSNGNIQIAHVAGRSGSNQPVWNTATGQSTTDATVTWINSGPRSWQANATYAVGQYILDSNGNIQIVQIAGKSDAREPGWDITIGQSTTDATVTWINSGPGPWRANTAYAAGKYALDSNNNLQCAIIGGHSGGTPPAWQEAQTQTAADGVVDGTVTWVCTGPSQAGLFYCNKSNRLQLRSVRTGGPPPEDFTVATKMVEAVPMAQDEFGTYARWDSSSGHVVAGGSGPTGAPPPDEVPIYVASQTQVSDLVLGYDGILYIAVGGALVMVDRRNRWPDFTLTVPDFSFWRLAALPEGGVLALDRNKPQLGKVVGQPLQTGPVDTPNPGIMRSCEANPNPPRIVWRFSLPTAERFVALTPTDPSQNLAQFVLLSWLSNSADNQIAYIRIFSEPASLGAPQQLDGVRLPYSIAGLGNQKLAALATNLNEALIYDLSNAGGSLVPAGETYILAANNLGPFVHGFSLPPNYANASGATPPMLPLLPLSLNSFAASGATNPTSPSIIDSGTSQTVWHRMFLEAVIPPRCGAIIWLTASDKRADLTDPSTPWYPHVLGAANLSSIATPAITPSAPPSSTAISPTTAPAPSLNPGVPSAVWQSIATEVPFAPTLLNADIIQDRQGLFMVLAQRAYKAVRNLSGRYLGVRIQLNGDGRNTPEIAGLRIYASRFSYVQHYLPEIYHENKFAPDADQIGNSTHRDFFERFIALFESQFTRIEDRVANAYLLTRPESSPGDSLGWLGSWIGIEPNNYPPDRRRARLEATPSLYRRRGTTGGITQALDVATNGMCTRGAIIVIEDFRLRHIFATILGADLSIQNDPLLPGYSGSSNSIVGDTLFLGDPGVQAELQALYASDLNIPGSAQAVQSFYDQLAHRMTVFIHDQVEKVNVKLVQRIVEDEKPAHVQAFVRLATQPFMIGLASLLGVNTYLGPEPPRNTATLDVSDVGRYDVVAHIPSLDPRLENGRSYEEYDQPVARIQGPVAIKVGDSIVLDGGASTAPSGVNIMSYIWNLIQTQS
jgi:phage tail-like protein